MSAYGLGSVQALLRFSLDLGGSENYSSGIGVEDFAGKRRFWVK
jgi:hypothetical protein